MKTLRAVRLILLTNLVLTSACAPTATVDEIDDQSSSSYAPPAKDSRAVAVLHSEWHAAGRYRSPLSLALPDVFAHLPGNVREGYFAQADDKEQIPPDGVGRFQFFSGPSGRGAVYWHLERSSGAHAVYGGILDEWERHGWEVEFGYPIDDAYWYSDATVEQHFETIRQSPEHDELGHVATWRRIASSDGNQTAQASEERGWLNSSNPDVPSRSQLPCTYLEWSYPIGSVEEYLDFPTYDELWCGAAPPWEQEGWVDPTAGQVNPRDI